MLTIEFYIGNSWVGGNKLATLKNTPSYNIPNAGDFIRKIDGVEYMVVNRAFYYGPDETIIKIYMKSC